MLSFKGIDNACHYRLGEALFLKRNKNENSIP